VSYLKLLRQSKARRNGSRRREAGREMSASQRGQDENPLALPVSGADARKLTAVGYRPKVSFFGRVIWERPDTGFYVSQEMALHLLNTNNVRSKSGADERR
jgi:hypothetical protein